MRTGLGGLTPEGIPKNHRSPSVYELPDHSPGRYINDNTSHINPLILGLVASDIRVAGFRECGLNNTRASGVRIPFWHPAPDPSMAPSVGSRRRVASGSGFGK